MLIDPGTPAAAGPSIFCLPGLRPKICNLTNVTVIFSFCFYGCEKRGTREEGEQDEIGGGEKIENVMEEGDRGEKCV